jgi:ABC-type transporter Mla MlaB component
MRRAEVGAVVVLVRDGAELASWPLTQGDRLDLAVVDQLARWHLAARRLGYSIELRGACPRLVELLNLVGLSKLVGGTTDLRLETCGQAESGEQCGVEEVVMPDDPIA